MAIETPEERSPAHRRGGDGKARGGSRGSGSASEKPERTPKDVTGINPRDMQPIDPRMPYIPPP